MRMLSYIRKYYPLRQFALFIFLCALVGCITAILIPVESNLIDEAIFGIHQGTAFLFQIYLGIYFALLALTSVLESLLLRNAEHHAILIDKTMDSQRLWKTTAVAFPITETQKFHDLLEKSGKAAKLDADCYKAMQGALIGSVKVITSLAVLMTIDVWLVVLLSVFLLIGIAVHSIAAKKADGFWGEYIQNMRHANYHSSLLLHREYASERKAFGYEQEIGTRYDRDFSDAVQKNSILGKRRLHAEVVVTIFSVVYSTATFFILLHPLYVGHITLGAFIAAFTAANKLRGVSNQIYDAVFTLSSSFKQMSGFFAFLGLEEATNNVSDQGVDLSAGIEFQNVSFTYPNADTPLLENISFTLHPGKHYALVGENGCGKTTLVKLLLGLYRATQGTIRVGGKDIQSMTDGEKHRIFSVMFQDFYRYPLSVRENVSLSSEFSPSDKTIHSMLNTLGVRNPAVCTDGGLDTNLLHLKNGGVNLSGGEWQKVTAARCILSGAPITILDEPNAALDPLSEEVFYRTCAEMLTKKTTLFISHRLGSVKQADEIMVLCDKKLIAMAHHEALMGTCEYYANLFETQRGLYYGT